jgi:hypothetical protein
MLVFGVERKMATPEAERRHSKRFPMVLPVTVKPQDGGWGIRSKMNAIPV